MERQLPHNLEAEKGILGSLIIDPDAVAEVADFLQPSHFYRDAHVAIYTAILQLYEKQEPADYITLSDALERQGKLGDVGGPGYIAGLVNQVPTSGNAEYYARIVETCAIRRRLIHAAGTIAAEAYQLENAEEALEKAEQAIYAINQEKTYTDFSSDSTIVDQFVLKLMDMRKSDTSIVGIPTGFSQLDYCLGGLQPTDLIIVAARPAMGKSSWAMSVARNAVIDEGKSVAVFSLEMSKEQLGQRLLSMDAGINQQRLRTGYIEDDEWERIMSSRTRLSTNRLWIDDTAGISLAAMRSKLRRLYAKHPFDIIIVDYLQLMTVTGIKADNRVLIIGEITKGLKNLAKEFNVPVVALAQLSREVEKRAVKIPQLSDLRESGSIENDADVVMFIYRDEVYNPESDRKGQADIIVAKHRNGPTGEIVLQFDGALTRFSDLEAPTEVPDRAYYRVQEDENEEEYNG